MKEHQHGYRPDFWPTLEDGSPARIGDMCQMVHEIRGTGSLYPYFPHGFELCLRCLTWIRDNWRSPTSKWEAALLRLVIETLDEHDREGER